MVRRALPIVRRGRQHGVLRQLDRRDLERDGWRTTLEYRENHRRDRQGRLLAVTAVWYAEAERDASRWLDGRHVEVISASAGTIDGVWSRLRLEAELSEAREAGTDRPPTQRSLTRSSANRPD